MLDTAVTFLIWLSMSVIKFSGAGIILWLYKELTMGICSCASTSEKRLKGKVSISSTFCFIVAPDIIVFLAESYICQ
jgi:hypothetical protein